jgi:magnesium transporter
METMRLVDVPRAIRAHEFAKLHDVLGHWEPFAVAEEIRDLPVEDQAVVFRVLPRECPAGVFEFLDTAAQERLLKALGHEEVAAILNNMADDDRTALLEELPAAATKQMLAVLAPKERAVALSLLGYPPGSIGRLMTPHYIAIRQDWTVQQVLDYVRTHGEDSETLNLLYVIDDKGLLIDDIRLREFLLTSTANRVADLMDYRFLALKATDPQETAIGVFKREDRKALPVVDSAGILIGIVTVDDVLKVAENQATREIQRIGGSEALDEPYMQIGLARMVKKRAGWLVILFLGEMLTATAMGFFEFKGA